MKLTHESFISDQHGWAELLSERKASKPLTGNHRVPWVVVGAGVTGLACARQLAALHPNQDIILLDARKVGQGASARSSGFAMDNSRFGGPFKTSQVDTYRRINRINQAGLNILRRQTSELGIECQWHEEGVIHTAADQKSIKEYGDYLNYLETLEIPHTHLDADAINSKLGTSLYQLGIHVHTGALVQPAALVRGLADNLPPNVTLYEQSPVLKIDDGQPLILSLPNGTVHTDKLILATNYEASKLGFLNRYLTGITLSGSFTRVLSDEELSSLGNLKQWGVLSLHNAGATVRLTADKRICLRNTAEYHGGVLLNDTKLAQRKNTHRAAFKNRFPQLQHVPFEYSWSGVEGISRNNTNFFGQQKNNVFYAGGYNGSGISRGTAFGTALADYANAGQSQLIEDCLASVPAVWTPPRPFLDVGAFLSAKLQFLSVRKDK